MRLTPEEAGRADGIIAVEKARGSTLEEIGRALRAAGLELGRSSIGERARRLDVAVEAGDRGWLDRIDNPRKLSTLAWAIATLPKANAGEDQVLEALRELREARHPFVVRLARHLVVGSQLALEGMLEQAEAERDEAKATLRLAARDAEEGEFSKGGVEPDRGATLLSESTSENLPSGSWAPPDATEAPSGRRGGP